MFKLNFKYELFCHHLCNRYICKIPLADNNNSERFYQLMAQVIPDWEKIKKQLDGRANRFFGIKVEF